VVKRAKGWVSLGGWKRREKLQTSRRVIRVGASKNGEAHEVLERVKKPGVRQRRRGGLFNIDLLLSAPVSEQKKLGVGLSWGGWKKKPREKKSGGRGGKKKGEGARFFPEHTPAT